MNTDNFNTLIDDALLELERDYDVTCYTCHFFSRGSELRNEYTYLMSPTGGNRHGAWVNNCRVIEDDCQWSNDRERMTSINMTEYRATLLMLFREVVSHGS